jgi:hypothetical protein
MRSGDYLELRGMNKVGQMVTICCKLLDDWRGGRLVGQSQDDRAQGFT